MTTELEEGMDLTGTITTLKPGFGFISSEQSLSKQKDFFFHMQSIPIQERICLYKECDVDFTLKRAEFYKPGEKEWDAVNVRVSDSPRNKTGIYSVIITVPDDYISSTAFPGSKDIFIGKHTHARGKHINIEGLWKKITHLDDVSSECLTADNFENFISGTIEKKNHYIRKQNIKEIKEITQAEYQFYIHNYKFKFPRTKQRIGFTNIPSDQSRSISYHLQ